MVSDKKKKVQSRLRPTCEMKLNKFVASTSKPETKIYKHCTTKESSDISKNVTNKKHVNSSECIRNSGGVNAPFLKGDGVT